MSGTGDVPGSPDAGAAGFELLKLVREKSGDGEVSALRQRAIDALRQIRDPEIAMNIYDLGLVYRLDVDGAGKIGIEMTLTAPGCPVAQSFPGEVESALRRVPGVTDAKVELVWDPPWSPERLSEEAKLQLGLF